MKLQITNLHGRNSLTPHNPGKKVVVIFDSDRTLIPIDPHPEADRHLKENLSAVADNYDHILTSAVITGRGSKRIKAFSEPYKVFSPIPFYLSTDSGKGGIFFNPKGECTGEWLTQLNNKHKTEHWVDSVENHLGWDQEFVINKLKDILLQKGFQKRAVNNHIFDSIFTKKDKEIHFVDDQTLYSVKILNPNKTKDYIDFGNKIAKEAIEELKKHFKCKINIDAGVSGDYYFIDFRPTLSDGRLINKLSVSETILSSINDSEINQLQGVIMLGDSINDEHLKATEVEFACGKNIPVYSVFSGTELIDNPKFNNHPRIRLAEIRAHIGPTLRQTIAEVFA